MLRTRIIPCLLLKGNRLVKTVRFKNFSYIGDPINTVRIFNELQVDELLFLDITATVENRPPAFHLLSKIADECFMPLSYGGGVRSINDAQKLFSIGIEKIAVNTYAFIDASFLPRLCERFGSQSVIGVLDVRKSMWGKYRVYSHSGRTNQRLDPVEWACHLEEQGVGELLVTAIDREGTWQGFDIDLVRSIAEAVTVPVIAHGGASAVEDIGDVVRHGSASAVALGNLVVYQGKGLGVLINFPDRDELSKVLP